MLREVIGSSTALELYKLNNLITRKINNYQKILSKKYGLEYNNFSHINGWILRFLYNNRGRDVFLKDVEEEFKITRSTASKIVRLMEKKGLIRSENMPEDARLKKLVNTEKARQYREFMHDMRDYIDKCMFKGFTEEERYQLNEYLERLIANLNE